MCLIRILQKFFFRTTASKLISVKQIDPEKNKEERQKIEDIRQTNHDKRRKKNYEIRTKNTVEGILSQEPIKNEIYYKD